VIRNGGETPVDAVISVIGASVTPEPPIERNLKLERAFYTLEGQPVSLESATGGTGQLQQTDRLVVVLKVEASSSGRLLLVDRLPAGLEIENPRLVESGDLRSFAWLNTTVRPEHTEFRDDRFVAAFDLTDRGDSDASGRNAGSKTMTVAYIVRAVTPGTYVHPAATVEDMYRPERFARTAQGQLVVLAKQ